jgi:hypothetical protein
MKNSSELNTTERRTHSRKPEGRKTQFRNMQQHTTARTLHKKTSNKQKYIDEPGTERSHRTDGPADGLQSDAGPVRSTCHPNGGKRGWITSKEEHRLDEGAGKQQIQTTQSNRHSLARNAQRRECYRGKSSLPSKLSLEEDKATKPPPATTKRKAKIDIQP